MNLRLGRFGRQESACAVGLGSLISGIFALNVEDTFAEGNVCYLATVAGTILALLLLCLLDTAMGRWGAEDLSALLQASWGRAGAAVLAVPLSLGMALAAVLPLFRFTLAMEQYIFVEADHIPIALYLLPVLLLLVLRGMECVARMAKLLLVPGVLALGLTLILASPAFAVHHLYPLFSPGAWAFWGQTVETLLRFLPPGMGLLTVGRGCQGRGSRRASLTIGLLSGGTGAGCMQLGLGLTFFGPDMAALSAPVYCMTMAARQERMGLRLDVLVLFLWVSVGLVAAGFYLYAAALLLCQVTGAEDVRPIGGLLVLLALGLVLLFNFDSGIVQAGMRLVYSRGHLLFLLPLGVLLLRGLIHRRGR